MGKKINLEDFHKNYKRFDSIPTWTKEKHSVYEDFLRFLKEHEFESLKLNYDKLEFDRKMWSHSISKVPVDKTGKLKKYRGVRVLFLVVGRHSSQRTIWCFPLRN